MKNNGNIELLDFKRGSPNKLFYILGALVSSGDSIRQIDLAENTKLPVSTVVDQIKKANQILGMSISTNNGVYKIETWSPLLSKRELSKFFNAKGNAWDIEK